MTHIEGWTPGVIEINEGEESVGITVYPCWDDCLELGTFYIGASDVPKFLMSLQKQEETTIVNYDCHKNPVHLTFSDDCMAAYLDGRPFLRFNEESKEQLKSCLAHAASGGDCDLEISVDLRAWMDINAEIKGFVYIGISTMEFFLEKKPFSLCNYLMVPETEPNSNWLKTGKGE